MYSCRLSVPAALSVIRSIEVVRISEVKNTLYIWQKQSVPRHESVVRRLSVTYHLMPGSEVIINNLGEIFNTVLGTIMDVMWNLSTLGTAQSVLITEVTSIQGYLTALYQTVSVL